MSTQRQAGRRLLSLGALAILLGILTADLAFFCWLAGAAAAPLLFLLSMGLGLLGMLCIWWGRPKSN